MKTKGQRKAEDRRIMRKREKKSIVFRGKMSGDCCRRSYGDGVPD